MSKKLFTARFSRGRDRIEIGVPLLCWEEDSIHFIYAPSLDITGYGNSESEAKQSFEHMVEEFVNYTHNKNTFWAELERLGWTTNRKKKRMTAPNEEQMLEDNETYQHLQTMPNVRRHLENIAIAV